MEEPPEPGPQRAAREQGPARPRLGVDFVQRDARNRELGRNGEEWGACRVGGGGDGSARASAPRMYPLTGALDQVCRLEPQSFVARVG